MSPQSRLYRPKNFKLTTAEILYRLPDYPDLLQCFVWQKVDTAPEYPMLRKFLEFWENNLEGPIYSVRVAGRNLVGPPSLRCVDKGFTLH